MLERITIQIPREAKESLRKECFEKRTSYREIVGTLILEHYGIGKEVKKSKREDSKNAG